MLDHFSYAEKELTKPGATKQLLWLEYRDQHPDGYGYSQYCYHFSQWLRHKEVVMHLEHKAAETIMIDFADKKLRYTNLASGEVVECQVFIAVLPHSGLIFCIAVHSQRTADLAECLNAMLRYYGGVTLIILCDNLKTAVTRPDKYEPLFTDMCYQLSEHYGTTFNATRPAKPRDKAMVERSVNIVYNHIYGPLRNRVFHSLKDLNAGIAACLEKLNNRRYKGSSYSRRQRFDNQERALLRPLPSAPFTLKRSIQATVQRNYHIQLSEDHRYYSVPYGYVGKKVKILYDNKTLEVYYDHTRIALHHRSSLTSAYITHPDHMPSNHRYALQAAGFTQEELLTRAGRVGPQTALTVEHMLSGSIYPEQNYKACHGLLMLQKTYGGARLENACARALTGSRINYTLKKISSAQGWIPSCHCRSRLPYRNTIISGEPQPTNESFFVNPYMHMNTTATLQQMEQLKLHGMAASYQTQLELPLDHQLDAHDLIAQLLQAEILARSNERTAYYIKQARFRLTATPEDIECSAARNLSKLQLAALLEGSYLKKGETLLVTGPTGCGKSHLACALGHQACIQGYKTLYLNLPRLMERITLAKLDGSYVKLLNQFERIPLIILDDFGLVQPLEHTVKLALLQILEDRYGKKSLIITSQLPVSKWHDYINEPTLADAIMDRLTARAHRIELKGESMRKKKQ